MNFDADVFETALNDVMGGPVEFNGRTIMPPVPGMDGGDLAELVRRLTVAELETFGNGTPVFGDGTVFDPSLFNPSFFSFDNGAQLVTAGPGRYLVFVEGLGFVSTPDGEPYVLDLREAHEAR